MAKPTIELPFDIERADIKFVTMSYVAVTDIGVGVLAFGVSIAGNEAPYSVFVGMPTKVLSALRDNITAVLASQAARLANEQPSQHRCKGCGVTSNNIPPSCKRGDCPNPWIVPTDSSLQ